MNSRYVTPIISQYLYAKADRTNIPLGGTFELTPTCNMNCKMCYVRKDMQDLQEPLLTVEEWLDIARQAREKGLLFLLLTGGEPFMRRDFKELYLELHKMGFMLSINSNGTLITEKEVDWLKQAAPTRINITVYGASDATYEKLCGNPNGYTQVMHAIRLLKEAGIQVKLNCSITPYNAQDLHEIKKMAVKEGLFLQTASYMYPPLRKGRAHIGKNHRFEPEQAAYYAALSQYYEFGSQAFLERLEQQKLEENCTAEMPDEMKQAVEGREHIRCRAGVSSFWITWNGKMTPCGMMDKPETDVRGEGFAKAWKSTVEKARQILMPAKCTNCTWKAKCVTCAAMVLAETGDYEKAPEYRCRMMENYYVACGKVKKQILSGEIKEDIWHE